MGIMGLYLHAFLTFAINVAKWLASCSSHFTPKKTPQHPLSKRLGALQSWSACSGEYNNLLVPATNQTMIPQSFNA